MENDEVDIYVEFVVNLTEELQLLIEASCLGFYEIARLSKIDPTRMSEIMDCEYPMTMEEFCRICWACQISPHKVMEQVVNDIKHIRGEV